ncbi:NAD(P)H-dependent flavin oxidoreductase [Williamsia phyllosphaerae]|uniref:Propionate 3-nitronate monooxygenase n=1 Tax=Williamsia phyllosphaerae TaxID=885042 RepID=A0ABQ1UH90_9NOCA|nr:nitronate monooxygenase [Williamsia phyllosphaerae]GGF16340.1 oxidoreductase [Williamsia phyllosphaerae]
MTPTLSDLTIPVIGAPMAGGPSTDDLVAAVSGAGGLGFLATAYRSGTAVTQSINSLRDRGTDRFGANVFVPDAPADHVVDRDAVRAYRDALVPRAEALGVTVPEIPEHSTDAYDEIIAVLVEAAVPWVSFTFGLPSDSDVAALRDAGSSIVITVTDVEDARAAVDRGADVVWVQGPEAGGHRSTFSVDATPPTTPLDELLPAVRAAVSVELIASGGVASGSDVARLLDLGADAVAIGTLLLDTPEAGTSGAHRRALGDPSFSTTVLTRAFSGRPARGLDNAFHRDLHELAPAAFPELNTLTSPLRKAAAAQDDPDGVTLWAGTGFGAVTDDPAATVVRRLWAQAREHR